MNPLSERQRAGLLTAGKKTHAEVLKLIDKNHNGEVDMEELVDVRPAGLWACRLDAAFPCPMAWSSATRNKQQGPTMRAA